ncbi:MAG: hypothetical protein VKJ85_03610 [Prochlorothrix sp.]|nr:hypothetical protein [Prochlorothrix sp.]
MADSVAIVTKGCLDDWNWVAKPLHLILFFVGFLLVFWAGFSGLGSLERVLWRVPWAMDVSLRPADEEAEA